jgi:hypothetical protein
MSMVAKFGAALAGSAVLTALGFGLVAGGSADLFLQPWYWVVSISLAGLAGLGMGNGIGSVERRSNVVRMAPAVAHPTIVALAA